MLAIPCRDCGKPTKNKGICTNCKAAREAARPSRQERGYDAEYDRNARAISGGGARGGGARGGAGDRTRGQATPDDRTRVQSCCVICGRVILPGELVTVEHITPLRHGGTNDRSNLGPAHAACNYGWRRNGGPVP